MAENDSLWFKDAIIYEVHVKAFFDSNSDGIGDFKGLTGKLDYIKSLGVNTIWLLPFFLSPLKDDGYDIEDYYQINPIYGTLDDFKEFIAEAKKRDLRIIAELIVNHTSDKHEWFQSAIKEGENSKYYNYYVWSDTPDKFPETRIIFQDTETSNWEWEPNLQKYYWHRFFSHQPDLNHNNPEVIEKINEIIAFWADLGVDGFRLDAIPYLCVKEGTNNESIPETHDVIKEWRKFLNEHYPNKVFLAEANQVTEELVQFFGNGDECHMAYHFTLMPRIYIAIKKEDPTPITSVMRSTPPIPGNCQWTIFLRNHDELTLEMVTDEERQFMWESYAKEPRMKLNLGIRRRLAPLADNDRRVIELLNSILLSMQGSPIIYYGDEIGMGDNIYLHDRNGVRTPMQWDNNTNAGFSKGNPHRLYLPLIIDNVYGYQSINVDSQMIQPNSLLNFTKKIIGVRKEVKAFGRGDIKFLQPENTKILAYTRTFEDEIILCAANMSSKAQAADFDLSEYLNYEVTEILSKSEFPVIQNDKYTITFAPYGFYWFKLQKE